MQRKTSDIQHTDIVDTTLDQLQGQLQFNISDSVLSSLGHYSAHVLVDFGAVCGSVVKSRLLQSSPQKNRAHRVILRGWKRGQEARPQRRSRNIGWVVNLNTSQLGTDLARKYTAKFKLLKCIIHNIIDTIENASRI